MILTSKCVLLEKKILSESLILYRFSIEKYIPWEPGMFFYINIENDQFNRDWSNCRPFSFASYGNAEAQVLIRKKKNYTKEIFENLKIGNAFFIKYAYGDFFLNNERNKCIIAGGSGISPFLSYFDWVLHHRVNSLDILFHSARVVDESFQNICFSLPKNLQVHQFITQQSESKYINRRIKIDDIIKEIKEKKDFYDFYLCGSTQFIKTFKNQLENIGVVNIFYEYWD